MKIGYVGLGKLGLPIALVAARHHDVVGFDVSGQPREILRSRVYPYREIKAQEYLTDTTLRIVHTIGDVVAHSDIVFVVVQTPHDPRYEGVTPLPETRVDFDYSYLRDAVCSIAECARLQRKRTIITVMSTVLPGTVDREIKPLLNEWTPLVYSPAFPAMGTAIPDFEQPEFFLVGVDDPGAAAVVRAFYKTIADAPVLEMSVASAEATKVFYNSFISAKIGLANAWMEICDRLGANVDDVTRALRMANRRIVSPAYMRGGMGDAGGCHPRDNIALSWLSRFLGMRYDLFGFFMETRERQTEFLADMCVACAVEKDFPIVLLGKAFKAGTNLTVGSAATLLRNILGKTIDARLLDWYDPHIDPPRTFDAPAVYFIATNHPEFYSMTFPSGSVVIDPWGDMPDAPGINVIRVGRRY